MKELNEISIPGELKYAADHEWVSPAAPHRVGVSDFAQDQLGDITYAELPEVGASFAAGQEFGTLESIKSVSSLYLPVAGKVTAVNEALRDDPGLVNREPYGGGWLLEIEPADKAALDGLMSAESYLKHLKDNA